MGVSDRPPRQARREQCSTMTAVTELFNVRDRNICPACGKKEIEAWNTYVKEAEVK